MSTGFFDDLGDRTIYDEFDIKADLKVLIFKEPLCHIMARGALFPWSELTK
jgi:hypothetical protein